MEDYWLSYTLLSNGCAVAAACQRAFNAGQQRDNARSAPANEQMLQKCRIAR
jgi:hypothetical protein